MRGAWRKRIELDQCAKSFHLRRSSQNTRLKQKVRIMGFLSRLSESSDLVSTMAERLGINIGDAILETGDQAAIAYRQAVLRCAGCQHKGECRSLLGSETSLDKAPSYCRNHGQFDTFARV